MSVASELLALRGDDGLLHVNIVHDWAAAHPGSALHGALDWNDATAARKYRLWQIRHLIEIHVVNEDRERQEISLRIDRRGGGGYRDLADVMEAPNLRAHALRDAIDEYLRTKAKYDWLSELAEVHEALERVASPRVRAA